MNLHIHGCKGESYIFPGGARSWLNLTAFLFVVLVVPYAVLTFPLSCATQMTVPSLGKNRKCWEAEVILFALTVPYSVVLSSFDVFLFEKRFITLWYGLTNF